MKSDLAQQYLSLRRALEAERDQLSNRLQSIEAALTGGETPIPLKAARRGRPPKSAGRRQGGMSAAGRARIAAAQRARWAKVKAAKATARPKRKISAAGRARIAAAQKALGEVEGGEEVKRLRTSL